MSKHNIGDIVYVRGEIRRIETIPSGETLYYMKEAPGIALKEKDIVRIGKKCDTWDTVRRMRAAISRRKWKKK